jgi:O-antigen ligase
VLFRFVERLFVVVLLLSSMHFLTGIANPDLSEKNDQDQASSALHMSGVMAEGAIDSCGLALAFLRRKRVAAAARAAWPLLGLAGLALLSAAWSSDPMVSFRRGVLLLASTLLAIYLGERYTIDELARLLAKTLCFSMMATIAFYFVARRYVVDYTIFVGAWKGLTGHKNYFGEYMAMAVILLLLVRFQHFRWLRYVFLATGVALLLLSRSAGALACCALIVATMPLMRWARLSRQQRLLFCTLSVILLSAGIAFIVTHTGLLLAVLGRDATMSGRTQLWAALWPAIVRQPLLGYGYDTFWIGMKGEVLDARITARFIAVAADNGYIELCLGLGLVGVVAFLWVFAKAFRRAVDYAGLEAGPIGLWPVSFLFFFMVHNIAESGILTRGAFSWLAFAIIFTSLAVGRRSAVKGRAGRAAEAYELSRQRWALPAR